MAEYGGWTGKTLRVDLTTGKITTEDTIKKYKDVLGGTGLGYKVLFEEVPVGTKAWDPENRIIFGVGPFTGSGAPTSARVCITSLFPPNQDELPGTGHMGGHWGAALKYAGWDSIIIQGKSETPVWLRIEDDDVQIRDASQLWGSGIFRATAEIVGDMGDGAHVAAIGQAGENLNRYSVVMCDRSHSAGGMGSVMGSKNLKAIGVKGSGSVKIAADAEDWEELITHYVAMMGANNQHVVPRNKEPWAEFSAGTRWTGSAGVYWGAADPPLEVGYCPGDDINKMGYRTQKGILDHGNPAGQTNFVRGEGCHSCPIRCHVVMDVPDLEKYGVGRYQSNTCLGNSNGRSFYTSTPGSGTYDRLVLSALGSALFDDYGLWLGYSAETQVFSYLYNEGFWEEVLPEDEYKSIPWDLMEAQDPAWLLDMVQRVAYQKGVLGRSLAEGPGWMVKRWPELEEIFHGGPHFWKFWHSYHHSIESGGQVGGILCMLWNRDHNSHAHLNFYGNGLPLEIQQSIAEEIWGSKDAVTANHNYGPFNEAKARYAAACIYMAELHNSLTLCSYTLPAWASPLKSRDYRGDPELEAKVYTALTGEEITQKELENTVGRRLITLWRADTTLRMNEIDQRNKHDLWPYWAFEGDEEPFTPGSDRMDPDDIELTKDLIYKELGWDVKTGVPTRATLEALGLKDAADALEKAKLLPA